MSLKENLNMTESTALLEAMASNLKPTISSATTRYDSTHRVTTRSGVTLAAGQFYNDRSSGSAAPEYLPSGWTVYIHPEGQPYFVRSAGANRIVTEDYLYSAEILEKILLWANVVEQLAMTSIGGLSETCEVFLRLDDPTSSCFYYVIDHATQVSFWLQSVEDYDLNIRASVSDTHLRFTMEELYWYHVEYFPCHHFVGSELSININVNELLDVLLQARADHLSSSSATFSYTAEQCSQFIDIIKTAIDLNRVATGYMIWTIARLWCTVSRHRSETHNGQANARLASNQSVLAVFPASRKWWFTLLSRILFGLPDKYLMQFEELWTDQIVYLSRWRDFASSCREEWKLYVTWGFALQMIDLLSFFVPHHSHAMSLASALLCNVSTVAGVMLLQHRGITCDDVNNAAIYIEDVEHHSAGFQPIALAYSLPKGVFFLALFTTSLQGLVWGSEKIGSIYSLAILNVVFGMLVVWVVARIARVVLRRAHNVLSMYGFGSQEGLESMIHVV